MKITIYNMLQITLAICLINIAIAFALPIYGYFNIEKFYGFYAIFGFASFCFIIFAARILQRLLSRPQNYYSPHSTDNETYIEEQK